jgi:hypothetical protein
MQPRGVSQPAWCSSSPRLCRRQQAGDDALKPASLKADLLMGRGGATWKLWCQLTPVTYKVTQRDYPCTNLMTPSNCYIHAANLVLTPVTHFSSSAPGCRTRQFWQ